VKISLYLLLLFACGQSKEKQSNTAPLKISSGSATYCCDTIKTLNHTAIVKSILDTNGVLVRFEIVKVLK
jgi:arginine repressor